MASRSSPTKTLTRLFAVRGYSKLGQMPPGTPSTKVQTLYFHRHLWHVKVTPCGFVEGVPGCVAVHVSTMINHSASGTNISIEILDGTRERTVFRTEQVLGAHTWSKHLMVERSQLEAAQCVRNDYIPVRCTLTFFDEKKHKRQQRAAARAEWCRRLKRSIFDSSNLINIDLGLVLPKCHSSSLNRSTSLEFKPDKVRPGPVMFLDTKEQHQREETKKITTMVEEMATGLHTSPLHSVLSLRHEHQQTSLQQQHPE